MEGREGFETFPVELWKMILEWMDDPNDISNMAIAIPELTPLVTPLMRKNGFKWLFDQVAGFLLPWLEREEILTCRLVSKHWSESWDQALDNDSRTRLWPVPTAIYDLESAHWTRDFTLPWQRIPRMQPVSSARAASRLLQEMEDHPTDRNPFVGRSLTIIPWMRQIGRMERFWVGAQQFLCKFGHHLWKLDVNTPETAENPSSLAQSVLNLFEHLPNLKYLRIGEGASTIFTDGWRSQSSRNEVLQAVSHFEDSGLPPPPNLDSLFIAYTRDLRVSLHLLDFVLTWLSPQLRHLFIDHYQNSRYFSKFIFPKLNDLTIQHSFPRRSALRNLLGKVESPQLTKLRLELFAKLQYVVEEDIFPFLRKCPHLESLRLSCSGHDTDLREDGTISALTDSLPSLKSFIISGKNRGMNYNFLSCFPSLEFLGIEIGHPLQDLVINPHSPSPLRMVEFFRGGRLYESNVWELLPNLQTLSLKSGIYPRTPTRFTRAEYDNYRA